MTFLERVIINTLKIGIALGVFAAQYGIWNDWIGTSQEFSAGWAAVAALLVFVPDDD